MKKDRNCSSTPYPVYPAMQNQIPQMMPVYPVMPNQMQTPNMMSGQMMYNPNQMGMNMEQQLNSLTSQLSNLERRVSSLESIIGNTSVNTNYNNSNFQMM